LPPQYEFSPETEHTFLQRSDYQVVPSEVAESLIANAEAQARSITLQTQALEKSPALIEYEKVKKWDGKLPNTFISGGAANTLFQLK
nr:hypothetical protein [Candidatus Melainabacteria bacterium]